jgi:hypothetical protein
MAISRYFLLRTKIFQQKFYRKSKHNRYAQYIVSGNCAVYEIMWKNVDRPDRPQMALRFCVENIQFALRMIRQDYRL